MTISDQDLVQNSSMPGLRAASLQRLNNYANGDEADVSFVQAQKTQSLLYSYSFYETACMLFQ